MSILKNKNIIISLISLMFLVMIPHISTAKQIEIKVIPPNQPIEIFGNAWSIFIEGDIDAKSGEKLQKIIDNYKIPDRSRIYLSSAGGSLIGGIELGKVIRKNGLYSDVGILDGVKEEKQVKGFLWKIPIIKSSNCMSACVFAYMGGAFRFLIKNSSLGVHRFYSENGSMDSDVAQITSSYILQYINNMGVDEAIYHEMVKAGKDEINKLTLTKSYELKLVNNGIGNSIWTLESVSGGIYVKGERNTWRGTNKFLTACDTSAKKLFQTFIFDSEGRGDEIEKMKSISIFINSKSIPVEAFAWKTPLISKNIVTVYMTLPQDILNSIINAYSIGVAFQYTHESPMFLGFDDMKIIDGKEKLENISNLCKG